MNKSELLEMLDRANQENNEGKARLVVRLLNCYEESYKSALKSILDYTPGSTGSLGTKYLEGRVAVLKRYHDLLNN